MLNNIPFLVGLRYLRARRRNHFISFISGVSMVGLTLGVMVLIIVLSVMNGFDRELRNRILGMVPHATVSQPGGLADWPAVASILSQHPDVEGVSPFTESQAMLVGPSQTKGVAVSGVEPATLSQVSILPNHLTSGSLDDLQEGRFGILLGDILARQLGVDLGDRVTMMVPEVTVNLAGVTPRFKRFEVVGTFAVGAELDANLAVVQMNDLGRLLRYDDRVDGVHLKVDDLFLARQIAIDAGRSLQGRYLVSDWTRTQGNLFQAIQLEKRMVGLLLFMIVAVAVFNIVSSLVMMVTDKQGEIAILRTLGARSGQIMGIFIVQGTAIGLIGIALGVILGVLGAWSVADIIAWIEHTFHIQFLNAEVYFISYIPSELKWSDVRMIASASFVISVLATIYPAWRASRISPAEALRYES
ncbi:lipoprotein-releasing ABC transporter permease subunit [Saccharospirillum mangrovi]|uniref:lipoprotein-releasing ABC transporter permease subunit n=1 Tax=Saccharospirillum mangrovi TaxID=2161747 RepID=UPI000D38CAFB|nr:lipoprotein-releasing ABC transporter permease subunit [Saccharospirillum mangrovi]